MNKRYEYCPQLKVYDQIIDEIKNNKLTFKLTSQEQNHIKFLKQEQILKYILYRYIFKEYPKKKISTG